MSVRFRLSELARLSAEERARITADAVKATRLPNGGISRIEARIRDFEERFGISSAQMRREVTHGLRQETWELCEWLQLLAVRDELRNAL